jgi:hypothetical protein
MYAKDAEPMGNLGPDSLAIDANRTVKKNFELTMRAIQAIFPVLLLCVFLGGCATTAPGGAMENDPLKVFQPGDVHVTIKADKAVFTDSWSIAGSYRAR